ncbi:hypothetical protein [Acinetobacter sp. BSP-28]|uniref:hypothetical protein n=1 Tax=Acinetobacter sp. BSP-28 TaxID=3344661 RepID=UPI00376FD017
MSLADSVIESFNGYEKAKAVLDNPNARLLHNVEGLEQRLLEYRRQHNIYEAGDLVVHDAHIGDEIYEFISLLEDIGMATVKSKHMTGGCSLRGLRHATPEEIEANKRLDNEEEH